MHNQRRYATCFGMFKIKYAYPKKVCHMPTRHVKKKRERKKKRREKKEKRKKDSPYQKKKKNKNQEGDDSYKGVHPPSTKDIFTHTCTS